MMLNDDDAGGRGRPHAGAGQSIAGRGKVQRISSDKTPNGWSVEEHHASGGIPQ